MAIFSRIVVLTALAASFVAADIKPQGAAVARHLKHPQARAHHPHSSNNNGALVPRHKKRAADKKRACAAKDTSSSSSSSAEPASTLITTSTWTSTHHHHSTTQAAGAAVSTTTSSSGGGGSSSSSSGGVKRGLAWNDGISNFMDPFLGKVSWCYTWSPWDCCSGSNCPEFVPMFWSAKQAGDWNTNVMGKSFANILCINEPDQAGQSAMSVGDAISQWWQYIEPVNARKGSPAVTTSPNGLAWLDNFVASCSGCDIAFLCIHYYGLDAQDFISIVEGLHSRHPNLPIWVTEWAAQNYGDASAGQDDEGQVAAFLSTTQAFLDGASYVERYAWFGALTQLPSGFNSANRLITSGGSMTNLGWQYIA